MLWLQSNDQSSNNERSNENRGWQRVRDACFCAQRRKGGRNYEGEPLFRRGREGVPIRAARHDGEWKVLTPPYKSSRGLARPERCTVSPLALQSFAHRMSPSPLGHRQLVQGESKIPTVPPRLLHLLFMLQPHPTTPTSPFLPCPLLLPRAVQLPWLWNNYPRVNLCRDRPAFTERPRDFFRISAPLCSGEVARSILAERSPWNEKKGRKRLMQDWKWFDL
mgnify:CR=1 FL=1